MMQTILDAISPDVMVVAWTVWGCAITIWLMMIVAGCALWWLVVEPTSNPEDYFDEPS